MPTKSKKLTFVLSAIGLITGASVADSQQLNRSPVQTATSLAQQRDTTEKQKEHSKLYKQYKRDRKLPAIAATANDDVTIVEGVPQKIFQPGSPRFTPETFINKLGCNSDAVVIGVIKDRTSQLTENEEFVFTDSDLLVEDVLKNNSLALIQKGTLITVTRPGGTVQINGRKVRVVDEAFKPFDVEGTYLLFLRFIPATGAYRSAGSAGSYELRNEKTLKLTEESLLPTLENGRDARLFIGDVRRSIAGTCSN